MYSNSPNAGDAQGAGDLQSQFFTSFLGLSSVFAAVGMVSQAYLGSSLKLLVLGSLVETGRRLFQWLIVRFRFQYSITAQFDEGDPAYEWVVLLLTQENVWRRARDFIVSATNSRRKWSVKTWADPKVKGNAEYVPTYQVPQIFRWRGHWVEIKRSKEGEARFTPMGIFQPISSLFVTIYTLDMNLLSDLVEDARTRYVEVNRPNVVIHLADSPHYGPSMVWTNVKHKVRRPLSSIILQDGVVDGLVRDAQEFLATEDWYVEAGIPHRRGYLLYGPPGTGKTSTIYALAGALNLEIYSLSLASSFVDDSFLQRAASSIPQHALFLIEDIDCAFANRDDEDEEDALRVMNGTGGRGEGGAFRGGRGRVSSDPARSAVTLSGLLNVIDGVGSEDGKLFFATTNYIDRLDPALLRPGRIDIKVPYELSTTQQACALFLRFFPEARFPEFSATNAPLSPISKSNSNAQSTPDTAVSDDKKEQAVADNASSTDDTTLLKQTEEAAKQMHESSRQYIPALADAFAAAIPTAEFSTAELQGYLQSHKTAPEAAAAGASAWVESIRGERRAREEREAERRRRVKARREGIEVSVGVSRGTSEVNTGLKKNTDAAAQTQSESEHSSTEGSETESEFSSYVDGAEEARIV
ncbi:hypothetical protein B0H19DRAFT_1241383 [Mycena capillaripes]|nr:hypothetical protein B0H19DRAFT_1241383 [Mycena capillaripes]